MKFFVSIFVVLLLTACGFQPIHGKSARSGLGVQDVLAQIEIGNIPDREGQHLRNELIDRFYLNGRPTNAAYELHVERIKERLVDLDITKSSDATRGQLRLQTNMTMSDKRTGQVVLERELQSITSYNILGSEFSTRVTEENARTNALDDLARQVELQVGLYFKRR